MSIRVLVVDDEVDLCTIVKNAMLLKGFEVVTAHDGFSAISMAMKYRPDLIILDVMMPKMSGFKVCENLRRMPQFMETPILFLTAKDTPQDEEWGRRSGGTYYITKPFDIRELNETIWALLRDRKEIRSRPDSIPLDGEVEFED